MTNEEKKSNEIAIEYLSGHDRFEVTYEEMREAVLEMAKWKDEQYSQDEAYNRGIHDACQQFKEYLEFRKMECRRTAKIVYAYDMSSAGELEIKAKCYDEIINELFPATEQNMEG